MGIRRKKTLLQQAAEYVEAAVDTAREKAGPVLADAREKAGPALADAREKAGPAWADAKEKAGPMLADARDKAAPLLAQGAAIASERATAAVELAAEKAAAGRDLAAAKAAELQGKPKKKHRVRKLLLITGVAALLGFVAKKLQGGSEKDNWQSSYTPTPAPAPRDADATDTPIADSLVGDVGGAGPDEAIADAVEEQQPVTTPDEPADVVELEPGEEPVEKPSPKP
jgi:hypothetical protein